MRRRGVTLIEVLVVIALISILISLTVLAVQAARGMARRASCLDNMRQIGVALHSYAASFGVFPQGINGGSFSFHAMLLPHLDQRALFNAVNFSAGSSPDQDPDGRNGTVASTALNVFLCPADREPGAGPWTSYAGNRGDGVQTFGYNGTFPFEAHGPIGPAGFRDGMTSTVAVAEWVTGPAQIDRSRPDPLRSTFDTPAPLTKPDQLEQYAESCRGLDPAHATVNYLSKGDGWIVGDFASTLYNHTVTIGGRTCTNATAVQMGAWTAGSIHPGGANVLMADGNARFVTAQIALPVWRALGSRDGGEVIGESF